MDDNDVVLLENIRGLSFVGIGPRNACAYAACLYFFVLEGTCVGLWGLCIPYVHSKLGLSKSEIGAVALCTFLGVFSGAPLTGLLMVQFGVQRTIFAAGIMYGIILSFLVSAMDFGSLVPIMYLFGLLWGVVDTSANNSTVLSEMVDGKSRMGSCYGAYSVAAGLCSLVGGLIISSGTNIRTILIFCSVLASICTIVFSAVLYTKKQEMHIQRCHALRTCICEDAAMAASKQDNEEVIIELSSRLASNTGHERISNDKQQRTSHHGQTTYSPIQHQQDEISRAIERESSSELESAEDSANWCCCSLPKPSLLTILCCLGFLSTFGEAGVITWIIIYYEEVLHTPEDFKSVGFACFMVTNAIGRFACDYLRARYPRNRIILGAGVTVSVGLWLVFAVSFTQNAVAVTTIGFIITAFGLSTITPIVMSSAGRQADVQNSGTAVATAAACTYLGSIASSPIMGVVSDAGGSLRYGMLFATLVLAFIVPISLLIPPEIVTHAEHNHAPLAADSRHNSAAEDV